MTDIICGPGGGLFLPKGISCDQLQECVKAGPGIYRDDQQRLCAVRAPWGVATLGPDGWTSDATSAYESVPMLRVDGSEDVTQAERTGPDGRTVTGLKVGRAGWYQIETIFRRNSGSTVVGSRPVPAGPGGTGSVYGVFNSRVNQLDYHADTLHCAPVEAGEVIIAGLESQTVATLFPHGRLYVQWIGETTPAQLAAWDQLGHARPVGA